MFFVVPIEFFFFENDYLHFMAPSDINTVEGYSLNAWTGMLLTIMLAEILLNFTTSYYDQGIYILKRTEIVRHYLKSMFISDLVAFTALLMDCTVWEQADTTLVVFFYLKMINVQAFKKKILRIIQLKIYMKAIFEVLCLLVVLVFIAHMFAIGFYYVSALVTKYD